MKNNEVISGIIRILANQVVAEFFGGKPREMQATAKKGEDVTELEDARHYPTYREICSLLFPYSGRTVKFELKKHSESVSME